MACRTTLWASAFGKIGSYAVIVALALPNGPPVAYSPDSNTLVLSRMNVNIFDYVNVTYIASDAPPSRASNITLLPPTICPTGVVVGGAWQPQYPTFPFPAPNYALHPFYPITKPSQLQIMIPQVVNYVIQPTIRQFSTVIYNTTLYMPPLVRTIYQTGLNS